ncbi:MAG: hypothetical protein IT210_17390 [Armatimonadetes bacterium]|nr:hypothetical protein [Armatimonadota bacterium]
MEDPIRFNPTPIIPQAGAAKPQTRPQEIRGLSFQEILQEQVARQGVKFSAHAQSRLDSRQIRLSGQDMARIQRGVEKAAAKGSQESLVLKDDLALVVSIRNRTVITAIDGSNLKENVFTNIDSAVIV